MSLIPIAAVFVGLQFDLAFASDNGGLGGIPTVAPSASDVGATKSAASKAPTPQESSAGKASQTGALSADLISKQSDLAAKTATGNTQATTSASQGSAKSGTTQSGSTVSQSFNSWGFTGSQSRWSESAALSALSGSLSSKSSSLSSLTSTKTSGANALRMQIEPVNWKSMAFLGAIAISTLGLHLC